MSFQTADEIVDAGEHLPNGATLVIDQISWDDYEYLLEGLADRPGLRISYDCGRLEIVSPSKGHGRYERLIEGLVLIFCEVFHLKFEAFGSATWKDRSLAKGNEPECAYYIRKVEQMLGKGPIDFESGPPPDIAVEVDITRSSLTKFSIYAALGVAEVWRYDGKRCRFYGLIEGRFLEIQTSDFLPGLTGQMIAEAVELCKTAGQDEARKTFRRRIKSLKKENR